MATRRTGVHTANTRIEKDILLALPQLAQKLDRSSQPTCCAREEDKIAQTEFVCCKCKEFGSKYHPIEVKMKNTSLFFKPNGVRREGDTACCELPHRTQWQEKERESVRETTQGRTAPCAN